MPAVNDTILLELAKMYPGSSPEALADAYNRLMMAKKIIESGTKPTYDVTPKPLPADNKVIDPNDPEICGYKRSELKVKPKGSIKDDKIICCICGYEYDKSLKNHLLKKHKLTDKEYRELCGFSKDTKLYPKTYADKFSERLEKARTNRAKNLADKKGDDGKTKVSKLKEDNKK